MPLSSSIVSKSLQAQYQERLDRLTGIFADIVMQADVQSQTRCPYKNAQDECTAKFGCQNKRRKIVDGEKRFACVGDGKLDYRTAWETEPDARQAVKKSLTSIRKAKNDTGGGRRTLFDYADELARQVPTSCGRSGICHECIVEVHDGADALAPRTESESFLQGDYRLACQAVIAL